MITVSGTSEAKDTQLKLNQLAEINKIGTQVDAVQLPTPYNELLTQPLMTKSIEKYYQRSAIIETFFTKQDTYKNTYSRSIIMLVDRNKERNNPNFAQTQKEALIVELAFITINFNELPPTIREEIRHTNIPFGKLLTNNHIQILTQDRNYYKIKCNSDLASLIQCRVTDFIYGRTNTIIRADNKKWLAHVVEILPHPIFLDSKATQHP